MTKDNFSEYVGDQIKRFLPANYHDAKIKVSDIVKNNGIKHKCITVAFSGEDVGCNVYLDEAYKNYCSGKELNLIMEEIASGIQSGHAMLEDSFEDLAKNLTDFNSVKEQIFIRVINFEKNRDLLEHVPYTRYDDLAVTYRVKVETEEDGLASVLINDSLLTAYDISNIQLHEIAMENSKRLFPEKVQDICELLIGYEPSLVEFMNSLPEKDKIYVVSNSSGINGAGVIFYEGILDKVAQKVDSDLFILPSSIHECLAISAEGKRASDIKEMVRTVNATEVADEEILSDNVYYYDKEKKQLAVISEEEERLNQEANQQDGKNQVINRPRHHR